MCLKIMGTVLLHVAGYPSVIVLILLLLGFSLRPMESYAVIEAILPYIAKYGWLALLVLVVAVALETTYRTVRDDRAEAAKDFYKGSRVAQLERAHRVFCRLYKEGEALTNGTAEALQAWDRKVIRDLEDYGTASCVHNYFVDTNRPNYQTEREPLQDDSFPNAMEHLEAILSERFPYYIRLGVR